MANFSTKERFIASILSSTPGIKKIIKRFYICINAIIYKKSYNYRILDNRIAEIKHPFDAICEESFFGYYDKAPNINNKIIGHLSSYSTLKEPSSQNSIKIAIKNEMTDEIDIIGETFSYTWQQGARSQWVDDNMVMYNVFENGKYLSKVYSLIDKKIIKTFDFPVQDSYRNSYFLSLNYRRVMNLRPDYGYRNLPLLDEIEMKDYDNDGIWKIDFETSKVELLYSLKDIIECDYKDIYNYSNHKVNHVMINNIGTAFIFIHRYYLGKQRFDRLIYSDFKSLKVISDNNMVSHCCWVDDTTIFGYFKHNNKDGYYYCDINTGKISPCDKMTNLQIGDGHPSCYRNWIVFDSYPDKSRMQHLFLYNIKEDYVLPLLELYQNVNFSEECRCDLHPRFSKNGKQIFFDSVYCGKRQLCYIDVSSITKS